jgi:hypothetical protein
MQSHTRIIELLVSLGSDVRKKCVLQRDTNVGTGTLARRLGAGYSAFARTSYLGSNEGVVLSGALSYGAEARQFVGRHAVRVVGMGERVVE